MSAGFVLASSSPRRRALLSQLGLEFTVQTPDIDESVMPGEAAAQYVMRLAEQKSAAIIAALSAPAVVLAADTTVVHQGNILGKPESKEHGIEMLNALSGDSHTVLTGVSLGNGVTSKTFCVESEVWFRTLEPGEAAQYWDTGEPLDKAGGYGLQGIGAMFVSGISGSYTNVIGLPLSETVVALREFGVACLGVLRVADGTPNRLTMEKGTQHG